MGYLRIDPSEAFRLRLATRIRRVEQYREEHSRATVEEIAEATGYLPSSIRLWLCENEVDEAWRKERKKELRGIIYGR